VARARLAGHPDVRWVRQIASWPDAFARFEDSVVTVFFVHE
jgi:hypothetical protein